MSEPTQAKRYLVSGIVQGVGFRYFTQRAAQRLKLNGYTRNLPDGRVEVYAMGAPADLATLRSILQRGPWGATVSQIEEQDVAVDSEHAGGFGIAH